MFNSGNTLITMLMCQQAIRLSQESLRKTKKDQEYDEDDDYDEEWPLWMWILSIALTLITVALVICVIYEAIAIIAFCCFKYYDFPPLFGW